MKKGFWLLMALCFILPGAAWGEFAPGEVAVVSTREGRLNLRSSAGTEASVLTRLESGTKVIVRQKKENWYLVESAWHTGYVHKDYLDKPRAQDGSEVPEDPGCEVEGQVAYVNIANGRLNLRREAHLEAEILAKLPDGLPVILLSQHKEWMQVKSVMGTGYAHSSYLSFSPPEKSAQPFFRIHERPEENSPVIDLVSCDDSLQILEYGPRWCRVMTRDRYSTGYIQSKYLSEP